MSRPRFTTQQIAEFTERLRSELPPGSTVTTQVLHVSRTGMSREIAAFIVRDGQIVNISWEVAAITGQRYGDRGGVIVGGAGMDMTFALVYSLSSCLYPNGHRCTGSTGLTPTGKLSKALRCPSNDHTNDYGRLARIYDAAHIEDESAVARAAESGDDDAARRIRSAYVSARQEWIAAQKPRMWSKRRQHRDGGYAISRVHA